MSWGRYRGSMVGTIAVVWLATAAAPQVHAETPPARFYVSAVVFEGLVDTRRELVGRLLGVEAGQQATSASVERGIRRILDTDLFSSADWALVDETVRGASPTDRVLHVRVTERPSVRPIFAFERGGERSRLLIGVQEMHALGRGIEVGAQLDQLDASPAVEGWMYRPWMLNGRVYMRLSAGIAIRPQSVYEDGLLTQTFVRRRREGALEIGAHVRDWLRVGLGANSQFDQYDLLPQTAHVAVGPALHAGRVRREGFELHGVAVDAQATTTVSGSARDKIDVRARGFVALPWNINLAAQVRGGMATQSHIGDDYFVGGIGQLRVGPDGLLHGSRYWLANAEVRVASIDIPWFVLQHAVFSDVASVARWTTLNEVAAGVGVRIISPRLGHLTLRIDAAWSLVEPGPAQFSFGTAQFF